MQKNVSLQAFNTFGLAATAQYFQSIQSIKDLETILQTENYNPFNIKILGGGSNILLTKDIEGVVLKNDIKGVDIIDEDDTNILIRIGGGEVWHDLVLYCIEKGWAGIENLSLIPGTVGAAPIQNIGAYGVELQDVFHSLQAFHLETGETQTFYKKDCEFAYRESIFKKQYKGQFVITHVTLLLSKRPIFKVDYGAIQTTLKANNIKHLSIKAISDAVIQIRQSKLPDPKVLGNSGSFFKNPIIPKSAFDILIKNYPTMPHYLIDNEKVKVPAGWLIEQCGWKGKRINNTGSHAKQALVLVNYGNAKGIDIFNLSSVIQKSVKEKFNIYIEREVNVW